MRHKCLTYKERVGERIRHALPSSPKKKKQKEMCGRYGPRSANMFKSCIKISKTRQEECFSRAKKILTRFQKHQCKTQSLMRIASRQFRVNHRYEKKQPHFFFTFFIASNLDKVRRQNDESSVTVS